MAGKTVSSKNGLSSPFQRNSELWARTPVPPRTLRLWFQCQLLGTDTTLIHLQGLLLILYLLVHDTFLNDRNIARYERTVD